MNTKWLVLIFYTYLLPVNAVIVSGSRWSINGKPLILLGDYHQKTMHDKSQIALIEKFIGQKGTQCFFEGLPVQKMSFFDVYKKNFNTKDTIDLGTLGASYYDDLTSIEKKQSELLHKIVNYTQEQREENNFVDIFLQDFSQLQHAYSLNSLLSFFNKKYHLGYLSRRVIDSRLPFDLLADEVNIKKLDISILEKYLENFFRAKKRTYQTLLEKFEKNNMSQGTNEWYKLYQWYSKEHKTVQSKIFLYENALNMNLHNMSAFFADSLNELFNFDCIAHILNAIFFEKNNVVFSVFGEEHVNWIEKALLAMGLKYDVRYARLDNNQYKPSLWDQMYERAENGKVQKPLVLEFMKDVKQKLKNDSDRTYYYDDITIASVPLKSAQLKQILHPSKLLQMKTIKTQKKLQKKKIILDNQVKKSHFLSTKRMKKLFV